MSTVVVDAVEHLVRGIVDNPDDVRVDLVTNRRGRTVEVHVHPDDLGKVIGRAGRTATALRTLGRRHRRPRYPRRRGRHRPVVTGWEPRVVRTRRRRTASPASSSSMSRTDYPLRPLCPRHDVARARAPDATERDSLIKSVREHGARLTGVGLAGVASRDAADVLRWQPLFVVDTAEPAFATSKIPSNTMNEASDDKNN